MTDGRFPRSARGVLGRSARHRCVASNSPCLRGASGLAVSAVLVVGAALVGGSFLPTTGAARAASAPFASAQLINLQLTAVPALDVPAFAGTYKNSQLTAEGQDSAGDEDPDGVLAFATINGLQESQTRITEADALARTNATALAINVAVPRFISTPPGQVATLSTSVQCQRAPFAAAAIAMANTAADQITVLGHPVTAGTPTDITATGAELGHPATIGSGVVHVDYTLHRDPATPAAVRMGEAWAQVNVDITLFDRTGAQIYDGPLVRLRLGDVQVLCDDTTPTPTPTTATPTPTASPNTATPTPTPSTGTPTPSPTTATPTPTPSRTGQPTPPPTASPSSTGTATPAPVPSASSMLPARPSPSSTGTAALAGTGTSVTGLLGPGCLLLGSGTLIVLRTANRRRRH